MTSTLRLDGRVALVTGAARGIGRAVAETLAAHGAHLALTARHSEQALSELAERLSADHGVTVLAQCSDAADSAQVAALYQTVFKRFGRLDVLVNNAGVMEPGLLGMIAADAIERQLRLNAGGAALNLQAAAKLMRRRQSGSIISLASILGQRGQAGYAAYAASKAAVIGLTYAAARELGPVGIRVNAIAPGFVDTDLTATVDDAARAAIVARTPLGRLGAAAEVADAALFLASDLARFVTGQVLGVDGGWSP